MFVLDDVAPVVSLGVVYLPAVLLVSVTWGMGVGLVTSVASALAFNFFHIPPTGRFTVAQAENWVALAAFVLCAIVVSGVADAARRRGAEAEARAQEADLAAELARGMLAGGELAELLRAAGERVAAALGIAPATIVPGHATAAAHQSAFALRDAAGEQVATLLVPAGLDEGRQARLTERVLPSLQALVATTLQRHALLDEVVETAALRRSDDLKTAILRAVSQDLRSPLTAIITSGAALGSPSLDTEERSRLADGIAAEGRRLERVITNLLDLSRLEGDSAVPRHDWVDVAGAPAQRRRRRVRRASGSSPTATCRRSAPTPSSWSGRSPTSSTTRSVTPATGPVSVRARAVRDRLIVRVVDVGPGIPAAEQPRIFEPFYKGEHSAGSGLGLAIVRGFVEANGGHVTSSRRPGRGRAWSSSCRWRRCRRRSDEGGAGAT